MKTMVVLMVLLLASSAWAKPKKKPKEVDMQKVHQQGLEKAQEIKEKNSFYESKWNLSKEDQVKLEEKVQSLSPEEKKALRLELDTMDTQQLKDFIYTPKETDNETPTTH